MSYNVSTIPPFERSFKRLLKKYPSLKADLQALIDLLEENPTFGIPLGENCFKIRLAIRSKNKGKSGGARLITMVKFEQEIPTSCFLPSTNDPWGFHMTNKNSSR